MSGYLCLLRRLSQFSEGIEIINRILPYCQSISVLSSNCASSPYAGGVQVGSPEPPFKINDIHSMHVVEVLVYTLLALIHINYETEIDSR